MEKKWRNGQTEMAGEEEEMHTRPVLLCNKVALCTFLYLSVCMQKLLKN
jgi:hypothetical protein